MPEDRTNTSSMRKLAAIMFTDIVGYTAMMGKDEDRAFEVLKINKEIHIRFIEKYQGTLIKEMGDGMLVSFNSSSDAVRCAFDIQAGSKKQKIPLKIGIHEGEMVFSGEDVLGDGVNIASRLEAESDTGEITISEAIYRNVKNKAGIHTAFLEEKVLKNVDDPVKMYQVSDQEIRVKKRRRKGQKLSRGKLTLISSVIIILLLSVVVLWKYIPFKKAIELEKSIAVLPLRYLSDDPGKQYMADGLFDAITGHLSKVEELSVVSRTSVEQYRETTKTSTDIGNELKVNYIVEGSFLLVGDQLALIIQLITTQNDEHIFFKEYKRDYKDIINVQSEIAQTIAREIGATITPEAEKRINKKLTDNQEAYDLYLRAREYSFKGKTGTKIAIEYLHRAIELDPEFAGAYASLGFNYQQLIRRYEFDLEDYMREDYYDTMMYYANIALEIDPDEDAAYTLLALYYDRIGDDDESIKHFKRAIELNPGNGDAHQNLGGLYERIGQYIPALKSLKIAKRIFIGAPDYEQILGLIGSTYRSVYDYDKANAVYQELLYVNPIHAYQILSRVNYTAGKWDSVKFYYDKICELDSGSGCFFNLHFYYLAIEDFGQAWNYWEEGREVATGDKVWLFEKYDNLGYMLYGLGRKEEALEYFDKYIENVNELIRQGRPWAVYVGRVDLVGIYAFLGEKEKAYEYLYELEDKIGFNGNLRYIQHTPWFRNLWEDKEFKIYIERHEKKYAAIRAEIDRLETAGEL